MIENLHYSTARNGAEWLTITHYMVEASRGFLGHKMIAHDPQACEKADTYTSNAELGSD
jgi:hypothetical protein